MYTPAHYQEQRPEVLRAAIRDIRLGTFVTAGEGRYEATHLPTFLKEHPDGRLTLEAHVARANPHVTILKDGPLLSLAMFRGPQAYVSPSYWATKREHGKVVPTWNYIAVHAHGELELVDDEAWLLTHVGELTDFNESALDHPWSVSDAPADYVRALCRAIVGLRMRVERLEGSWRMNQNRPEGDRLGTIAGLSASARSDDQIVASIMAELEKQRAGKAR